MKLNVADDHAIIILCHFTGASLLASHFPTMIINPLADLSTTTLKLISKCSDAKPSDEQKKQTYVEHTL